MTVLSIGISYISAYHDCIESDKDGNKVHHLKPDLSTKITALLMGDFIIKVKNPHIIIDSNSVKIIVNESNPNNMFCIKEFGIDDNFVNVDLKIQDNLLILDISPC